MRSIAGHVAVALENALAISSVKAYPSDLTRERDRLSLLLEINNHVVTILDINDLFRAASASIRKHFANDFTSFMLFDGRSDRLNVVVLEFPASRGFMSDIPLHVAREDLERLRARRPKLLTASEQDATVEKICSGIPFNERPQHCAVCLLFSWTTGGGGNIGCR